MIASLLSPETKQKEMKMTLIQAKQFMYEDRKVYAKFIKKVKIVKDKRDKEASERM